MVVKTNTNVKRNFVMNSSHDSDGGADYVDGVDSLDAVKFNDRWNKLDAFFDKKIRSIDALSNNLARAGILSVSEYGTNNLFGIEPFSYDLSGLDVRFRMSNCCILAANGRDLIYPFMQFKDFMEEDNPQLTIYSGSSNLHIYNRDVDGIGFYRLGHDGGEVPNVNVLARIPTLTAQAVTGIRIKFKDVLSANQVAIMKCYFNDTHSSYIQLQVDAAGYTLIGSIWNGAGMTAINTLISGTRLAQTHELCLQFLDNSVIYRLNATQGTISSVIPAQLKDVEFDHSSTTGGAEYLDYYEIEVYKRLTATIIANSTWKLSGVAIDESGALVGTTSTGNPPANLVIPPNVCPILSVRTFNGQTTIQSVDIMDARQWKTNFNLISGNTNYEHYFVQRRRTLDIRSEAEFIRWLADVQSGDQVLVRKGVTMTVAAYYTITSKDDISIKTEGIIPFLQGLKFVSCNRVYIENIQAPTIEVGVNCSKIEINRCILTTIACKFNGSYQFIHNCTFTDNVHTRQMEMQRTNSTDDSYTIFEDNRFSVDCSSSSSWVTLLLIKGQFIWFNRNYLYYNCNQSAFADGIRFMEIRGNYIYFDKNYMQMAYNISSGWDSYMIIFDGNCTQIYFTNNHIFSSCGYQSRTINADNNNGFFYFFHNFITSGNGSFGRAISITGTQRKIHISDNNLYVYSGFGADYCIFINISGGPDTAMVCNNIYGDQGVWQKSITATASIDDNNLLTTDWS